MTQALQELEAQLRDLNIKLSDAKQKEKQAALAAFKEQVALLGITQQEVLSALGYIVQRKRKAPAKYYDPTTGRSWSGRGPRPKWLEGRDLDTLVVDREAKTWWPGDDQG
ncbi:H-NS histone family protein [Burkholderia pyrrocinia]|uniref:H-NS histone family protein n=1 Tax=Burkholderia pyrrocinia TaxID=60550 RepID=UPI001576A3C6|nr:H-NS histone family protein [Burkholderia pyrrocinia]NTX25607.1 H-NS histone family protein [Burkholderia pyrrocinia]